MTKIISTDPAHGYTKLGEVDTSSPQEVKAKVASANKARAAWKELGLAGRKKYLASLLKRFEEHKTGLKELITQEVGKTLADSEREINLYFSYFKWFLDNVESALSPEILPEDEKSTHQLIYEPIGSVAVIIPWNLPFGMFVWGVVPNLLVGNTVIFKTSEECPLTGKFIGGIVESINLPQGVFSEIYGDGKVGSMLVESDVNLVWFTGSSRAGKAIYKAAAEGFKKVILEMGGSNAGIVFDDVDVDTILDKIYLKRYKACGQTCDALKRLIVHKSIYPDLVKKLQKIVESKLTGDPLDSKSDNGSLAAERQLVLLESQVADATSKGAKIVTGGKRPSGLQGAYYLPTLLVDVKPTMRVWTEEVFGPVLPIVQFESEEEAIRLANDSPYGLGAVIFSKDKQRAFRVAARLDSGTVEINEASHWLPSNPFGGYKCSGMGREHGLHGFRELCQIKVISQPK